MSYPHDHIGFPAALPGFVRPGIGGVGSETVAPLRKADPTQPYVSAPSYRGGNGKLPRVLPAAVDDIMRAQGPYVYHAMHRDPACKAATDMLRLGILAGGMDLAPAVKPKAGLTEDQFSPEEQLSAEIVKECWRMVERLPDWEAIHADVLNAVWEKVKLAEATVKLAEGGADAGKLVLDTLTVQENKDWEFLVAPGSKAVVGIQARGPDGEKVALEADKFSWLTWAPKDGDPRGTSEYEAANEAWNGKYCNLPDYRVHLKQFASGMIIGATAPNDMTPREATDPYTGLPIPGAAPLSPERAMSQELMGLGNGTVFVGPNGSTVNIVFPTGDGSAFLRGLDYFDRQITHAILGTTSATLEAVHDSRAKAGTGMDVVGLKIERGRKALAAFDRRIFRWLITLNHGPEIAAEHTPLVTYGQTDQQDRAALWGAASGLKTSGYLGESQVAELDQMIGLPMRDAAADEAKAKAKADEAMAQQQAMAPPLPGGPPADADAVEDGAMPPTPPPPGFKPKPAEFALDAPLPGPWHDADIITAQAIVRGAFPSAAALKRWERGEETADNRRVVLEEIADRAKVRLTADGQALAFDLRRLSNPEVAEFASIFESVSRWRTNVAKSLRQYYLAGTLALFGPGDLSPDEWDALRGQTEVQLEYLDGFATRLGDPNHPLDGAVGSNAGMYGQSVKTVAHAMERLRAIKAGMREERRVHVGDPSDMCPECKTEQTKKWQPIGTLKAIGECLCKTGCHCHFEYRR